MNPEEIRFAADAMLHLLAKWVRLLGYDCASTPRLHGRALWETAVAEHRWVLTRNRRFAAEMPQSLLSRAEVHPLAGAQLSDQLRELVDRFGLDPVAYCFTRCLLCNEKLLPVERSQVAQNVPPAVLENRDRFWQCSHCRRIFWEGSHVHYSIYRLNLWLGTKL